VNALSTKHQVTVAYQTKTASYRGQSFSYSNIPTRIEKHIHTVGQGKKLTSVTGYEFYSNPADITSIMLREIMAHNEPNLVIVGISNGTNMGPDIYSSSNVGMGIEAAYSGIPTIVIATDGVPGGHTPEALEPIIKFIDKNIDKFVKAELPPNTLLNINFPQGNIKGIKYTRIGQTKTKLEFISQKDPMGKPFYWSQLRLNRSDCSEDCDSYWYNRGYISITPICFDSTCKEVLHETA